MCARSGSFVHLPPQKVNAVSRIIVLRRVHQNHYLRPFCRGHNKCGRFFSLSHISAAVDKHGVISMNEMQSYGSLALLEISATSQESNYFRPETTADFSAKAPPGPVPPHPTRKKNDLTKPFSPKSNGFQITENSISPQLSSSGRVFHISAEA